MSRITLSDLRLMMEADEAANLCHKCHVRGHYSQECPKEKAKLWSLALCPKPKPVSTDTCLLVALTFVLVGVAIVIWWWL